jgi:hypothetical protein
MCCGDENMHQGASGCHELPLAKHGHHGHNHGTCGCGCGGRRFLSRKEKIEMLEEYRESLKNELEGVEEALNELKKQ